jgi:hypothetical protein
MRTRVSTAPTVVDMIPCTRSSRIGAVLVKLARCPSGHLAGTYYDTNAQVEALETLLRKLPDSTTPAPTSVDRPKPGRARQLGAHQAQSLIRDYTSGAVPGSWWSHSRGLGADMVGRAVGAIMSQIPAKVGSSRGES